MKNLLRSIAITCPLLVAPSCKAIHEILDVPGAVAEDVGGVIPGDVEPAPEVEASPKVTPEQIGEVAQTGTSILTGNSLLAAAVGSLATLIAGVFLKRKKATA